SGGTDTRTVNLANPPVPDPPQPAQDTPEAQARYKEKLAAAVKQRQDLVKARASELPDPSIEQIFLSEDFKKEGSDVTRSRHFTVRSSEKEPELVQASLDRLLRDPKSNEPLMKKVYMDFDKNVDLAKNREVRLKFYADKEHTQPATASPSFVK